MAIEIPIDVDLLKKEIKKTYAAVSDVVQPRDRASVVGVYRFWRDSGFVAGALLVGFGADAIGSAKTIALVAALTGVSGLFVARTSWDDFASADDRHRQLGLGR